MTNADKLKKFARDIIRESFDSSDVDSDVIISKAQECGLLDKAKYDPKIHGESEYSEEGDPWYTFSNILKVKS